MISKSKILNELQKKKIIQQYFEEKLSCNEIGKVFNVSHQVIRKVILDNGLKLRTISEANHIKKNPFSTEQIKEIIRQYIEDEATTVDIAKVFNTGQSQIRRILQRYCTQPLRTSEEVQLKRRLISNKKVKALYERYKNDINITTKDLSEEINVNRGTLEYAFKKNGLPLRNSHEAAARKTRIIQKDDVEELCRLHLEEEKSIKELATIYNCSYGTIARTLRLHGKIEIKTQTIQWNKQKIVDYAKSLVQKYGVIPHDKELEKKHRGWKAAVPRHIDGGMFALCKELGIKPKIHKYSILNKNEKRELCSLYRYGYTLRELGFKFNIREQTCTKILDEFKLKRRPPGGGGDCIESALSQSGNFKFHQSCEFYIVELKGYPTQLKVGIAFCTKRRAERSYHMYGAEHLVKEFNCRQDAFFIEEVILRNTINHFNPPQELITREWGGWTELREIKAKPLIEIFDYFFKEWEELGTWQFAASYVPMTKSQKKECERRATNEASD